jgi:hypothetical protein
MLKNHLKVAEETLRKIILSGFSFLFTTRRKKPERKTNASTANTLRSYLCLFSFLFGLAEKALDAGESLVAVERQMLKRQVLIDAMKKALEERLKRIYFIGSFQKMVEIKLSLEFYKFIYL